MLCPDNGLVTRHEELNTWRIKKCHPVAVHFDQGLGAAYSKHWSKPVFSTFIVPKSWKKERESKKIETEMSKKCVFWVCTQNNLFDWSIAEWKFFVKEKCSLNDSEKIENSPTSNMF